MEQEKFLKTVKTVDGKEYKVATRFSIENKEYIITMEKIVLIKDNNENVSICNEDDKYLKTILEALKPAKSLDIEDGEE